MDPRGTLKRGSGGFGRRWSSCGGLKSGCSVAVTGRPLYVVTDPTVVLTVSPGRPGGRDHGSDGDTRGGKRGPRRGRSLVGDLRGSPS